MPNGLRFLLTSWCKEWASLVAERLLPRPLPRICTQLATRSKGDAGDWHRKHQKGAYLDACWNIRYHVSIRDGPEYRIDHWRCSSQLHNYRGRRPQLFRLRERFMVHRPSQISTVSTYRPRSGCRGPLMTFSNFLNHDYFTNFWWFILIFSDENKDRKTYDSKLAKSYLTLTFQ